MNIKIKSAIICLILSAVAVCLSSYYSGFYTSGELDSIITDLIWLGVIIWIISDLVKKRNVLITLYLLSIISIVFTAMLYNEFGISNSLYCDIAEIIFLIGSVISLKKVDPSYWIETNS